MNTTLRFAGLLIALAWSVAAMASVTITDARPISDKEDHRDSVFSAMVVLADKAIKPDALSQLQAALDSRSSSKDSTLVISDLRVVDVFPRRAKAGGQGRVQNALMQGLVDSHTDWSVLGNLQVPEDQDSVVCLLSGTLDGVQKRAAAFSPYKLGGMSIMVHSDKHFRAAVTDCIGKLASQLSDS
jgi:hypothetical protein